MRIGLLNLMPNKVKTETQFARLLGASPLQVELTLVKITNHVPRNTPTDHIVSFYHDWRGHPRREVRRLHHHRCAGRDAAVRGGDLLGRVAPHLRLDADQRARLHEHLLGRAGGGASLPRHEQIRAEREDVRRLPAPHPGAGLALSARLLRRLLHSGVALDRSAARGHPAGQRHDGADGFRRGRAVPARRSGAPLAAHVQPHRIRFRARSPTSISATARPTCRSRCRRTISPTTIRASRRSTAGRATRICCSATGSTRSTRRPRSTCARSASRRPQRPRAGDRGGVGRAFRPGLCHGRACPGHLA